jgi:hypothetical protein
MYKLTKTEVRDVDPAFAEKLYEYNTFEGQRPAQDWHINAIRKAIDDGRFPKGNLAFAKNCVNPTWKLMNGQKTLAAIIRSGETVKCALDWFQCESDDDFWLLYAIFDGHQPRSERDAIRAAHGLFKDKKLQEVNLSTLAAVGTAIFWLDAGNWKAPNFQARAFSRQVKPGLLQTHVKEVMHVAQYRTVARISTTLAAAILMTYHLSPGKAKPFWDRVLIGDMLQRGTPEYELNNIIKAGLWTKVEGSGGSTKQIRGYNLCIAWWNAYVTGEHRTRVNLGKIQGVLDAAK